MNPAQVEAFVDAAGAGIDLDGLSVEAVEGGYAFSTPEHRREGLSREDLREAARGVEAFVTNWHYFERGLEVSDARRAYLRWLERADERGVRERYDDLERGVTRTWGQLAVTVRLADDGDGEREYGIRHVEDRDADPEALDAHTDPRDARGIAKFDDRGRYRPLKTAPSLRTGWEFVGLSGEELARAVDFIYPATVENWHREREGELDVTHWREAAARQTGIYGVVSELPREAVGWGAEACCVDSQCLKRRRWEFDADRELDADPGEGEFPCREPCSLFVAAAREWALGEREEARTYEFELTPGEREQVEAIVDAVAEGRAGEVREGEFDDPANRYRARYLRAKRFGDEEE